MRILPFGLIDIFMFPDSVVFVQHRPKKTSACVRACAFLVFIVWCLGFCVVWFSMPNSWPVCMKLTATVAWTLNYYYNRLNRLEWVFFFQLCHKCFAAKCVNLNDKYFFFVGKILFAEYSFAPTFLYHRLSHRWFTAFNKTKSKFGLQSTHKTPFLAPNRTIYKQINGQISL